MRNIARAIKFGRCKTADKKQTSYFMTSDPNEMWRIKGVACREREPQFRFPVIGIRSRLAPVTGRPRNRA